MYVLESMFPTIVFALIASSVFLIVYPNKKVQV
jgi:hypothetical protein